jgi:hypothetical protein
MITTPNVSGNTVMLPAASEGFSPHLSGYQYRRCWPSQRSVVYAAIPYRKGWLMARTQKRSARSRPNDVGEHHQRMPENEPRRPTDHSGAMYSPLRRARNSPNSLEDLSLGELRAKVLGAGTLRSSEYVSSTTDVPRDVAHFGVVIPAHNEEHLITRALDSLDRAISYISCSRVSVGIAVVLDSCRDRSSELVLDWRYRTARFHEAHHIEILEIEAGNVGSARRAGCRALLREWSDSPLDETWLATTDADSEVPRDWISAQLLMRNGGAQVWVGAVNVRDWSGRAPGTAAAWRCQYETEDLPIHGANFGVDAATYLEAGGFNSLETGEDQDLLRRAVSLGAVVRHDSRIRVVTSSRRDARAPRGFAHALTSIEATVPTSDLGRVELVPL